MGIPPPTQHIQAVARGEQGIEFLTRHCLSMDEQDADALIAREVNDAIAASHWDDAVKWQRVLLRVRRLRARVINNVQHR